MASGGGRMAVAAAPLSHRERLRQLVDRMLKRLRGGARVDRRDFYKQCLVLAKSIDFVISSNQVPHSTKDLLQLFKQVCTQKDDIDVRPAVMVLMLSFKGAMQSGWFNATADNGELFATVKLLFDQIGDDKKETEHEQGQILLNEESPSTVASPVGNLLCSILCRYFPRIKIKKIILSVEAKPGYEVLTSDFQICQQPTPEERLYLFVIRKDNIDTSTCLITPPHVNILINGYGVERRHSLSIDQGPQMPSDCTPMLKVGANLLQIVGDFQAPYVIVIASTTSILLTSSLVRLENHVLPSRDPATDDELSEGPSRISLCCPISRKRIVTPVKGVSCKHLQSFDFDNYLTINERRPAWRCPYCNMHVNCSDLRYDSPLGKILMDVEKYSNVSEILISEDGSWVRIPSRENIDKSIGSVKETEKMNAVRNFMSHGNFTFSTGTQSFSDISTAIVDLTQDDWDSGNNAEIFMERESSVFSQEASSVRTLPSHTAVDQEDRKPDVLTTAAVGVQECSRADASMGCDSIPLHENIVSAGSGSSMQSPYGSQSCVLTFTTSVSAVGQTLESIPMVNRASWNVADAAALPSYSEALHLPDTNNFFDAASLLCNELSVPALPQEQMRIIGDSGVQEGLDGQPTSQLIRAPITIQALPAQGSLSNANRVRITAPIRPFNSSSSIQATSEVPPHHMFLSNQSTSVRNHNGEEIHLLPTWHQQLQQDLPRRSIVSSSTQFEASAQMRTQTQGQHFQRLESPTHFQRTTTTMQYPTVPNQQRCQLEIPQPTITRAQGEITQGQHSMHSQQLQSFGQQQLQQVSPLYYDPGHWQQQRLINTSNVSPGSNLAAAARNARAGNLVQGDRVFTAAGSSPSATSAFPMIRVAGIVRPTPVQLQDGRSTLFPTDHSPRSSTAQSNMTNWVTENRTLFPTSSVSQLMAGQVMTSTDQNWRPLTRMRGSLGSGSTTAVRVATVGISSLANDPLRNINRVNSGFQSNFSNVPSYATICTPSSVLSNSLEYPLSDLPDHGFLPPGLSAPSPRYQTVGRPGGTDLYLSIAESLPQRFQSVAGGSQLITSTTGNSSAMSELAALNDFLLSGIEPCSLLPNLPLEANFN
ncbi:hypothetical protein O6H91_05G102100 [Diphasiastrum complanatum]|uniref:Uncharacterized protein n=1 Tax=Diphasiastrum complanatum TaxID=34168 RepID=A0ACC2DSA6_DIPCM|nr:hypothetical protein O6H91_05G102100 [Diphasiastrum complanatum]